MSIIDYIYFAVMCLLPIGLMIGCFSIIFSQSKEFLKSRLLRISRHVFFACLVISWILLVILFASFRKFHWINVVFGSILLILSAGSLLWLIKKLSQHKKEKKYPSVIFLFITVGVTMILLIGLQFLLRYSMVFIYS